MNIDFESVRRMTTGAVPFAQRAGVDLLEFERGRVKMKIPLASNQNHIGIMYAGALFTVAEIPGGALFLSAFDASRCYPILVDMAVKFLKPATTDVFVEARLSEEDIARVNAGLESAGKEQFVLDLALKDANDVTVATTTATYQVRLHRRG
jgi:acyl-coenzyme A thioesterase PaaI-like protein